MQEDLNSHFIKNIEIKNFKCFDNFKAEGFGRVNLIGGKNNVGKTAFMEAIGINAHGKEVSTLFSAILFSNFQRYKLENITMDNPKLIFEKTKVYHSKSNIREVGYAIKDSDGKIEYDFKIDTKEILINTNEFSYQIKKIKNIYFIDNFGFNNFWLKEVYIALQRIDEEETLNSYINKFDNSIDKFKIFDNSPECRLRGKREYRDINEFGDGLKQFISIICALYACEGGYLFIDEIDSGIHYTKLDLLWEIILTISKEYGVQVFATTHSKECIESYARVAKRLEDEDITMTTMARNPKGELKALVWNRAQFFSELEQNHEVRGW
jgi:AAA15 family ATPase/GTPase